MAPLTSRKRLGRYWRLYLFTFCLVQLLACDSQPPVRIATNLWPGYEPLHLAEQLGYFQDAGLNVRLVQMNSLADAYRAYQNNQVDGFTGTLVEVTQALLQDAPPLQMVLATDYSNGGDVIIAGPGVADLASLRGKKVGCEVNSLGLMVLQQALAKAGLQVADVTLVNTEQLEGAEALARGDIDAFVTYPPHSVNLLSQPRHQVVFSSREIPGGILDGVMMRRDLVEKDRQLVSRLHSIWQRAYDYTQQHPDDAFQRMASRQQITPQAFKALYLEDLHIYTAAESQELLQSPNRVSDKIREFCLTLQGLQQHNKNCQQLPRVF
jgi:NitT/TauT family transport system substrate-binding protein